MGKGRKKRSLKSCDGVLLAADADEKPAAGSSAPAHHAPLNAEKRSIPDFGAPFYSQHKTEATFYGESSFSAMPRSTSSVPCRYFQRGYCWNGDDCRFQHAEGPSTASAPPSPTRSARFQHPPGPSTGLQHLPGPSTFHSDSTPKASYPNVFAAPFNPTPEAFSKKERAPEECLDWYLTGSCPRFRTCRYAHPFNMTGKERFRNRKASGKGRGALHFLDNWTSGHALGESRSRILDDDSDDEDEMGQCMWNGGFTDDDIYELSLQGIKPWDAEAGAALAVLKGWNMDGGYGYDDELERRMGRFGFY